MKPAQRVFFAVILLAVMGGAFFQARQISKLQNERASLVKDAQRLQNARDQDEKQIAGLRAEIDRLNRDNAELPKLRDALATFAGDPNQKALWYMAATGPKKSATSGNTVAIDALASLVIGTNINVRNAIIPALEAAAANQNQKAAEALRANGYN